MKFEPKSQPELILFEELSPGDCFVTPNSSNELYMKIYPAKNNFDVTINCINLSNGVHGTWSGKCHKKNVVACERS